MFEKVLLAPHLLYQVLVCPQKEGKGKNSKQGKIKAGKGKGKGKDKGRSNTEFKKPATDAERSRPASVDPLCSGTGL